MKTVIIDQRASRDVISSLHMLGYSVLSLPPFSRLGEAVASHTDMLIARVGNTYFSHAEYCDEHPYIFDDLYNYLAPSGACFSFVSDAVSPEYPKDAVLNILTMGDNVFCRTDSVSRTLMSHLKSLGKAVIGVKQGYPRCTVLKLTDSSAVTADRGMAKALINEGIRVTLIEEGHISLPPYKYGFIGGCAGIDGDCVYFAGCIEEHPSYNEIRSAIEAEGLFPVSLGRGRLHDVGGILFCE